MAMVTGGEGIKKYLSEIQHKMTGKTLTVGFHEGKGHPSGLSAAEVAAIHNFGGGNNPPRPFFTMFVREAEKKFPELAVAALKHTNYDEEATLRVVGEVLSGDLKASLPWEGGPPLSSKYAEKKGFETVLIDTGALRNAIDYEISD